MQLVGFRQDVLSCVRSLDLFVMSSITEGLGTSLLDAMALGRPIVATTAGGIPEAVEDGVTGLLVPPQHAAPMAEAILSLLADPERARRMGAAGLARVRDRFSAGRMVAETLAVYERVAGTPRASDSASPRRGPESAQSQHPQVAEGKVVADRIRGIDGSQRGGDVRRHAPPRGPGIG